MESQVFTIEDCRADMLEDLRTGHQRGTTTYYKDFDNCWTWRNGEVTLLSGYSNEGKSLWLKQLCMIKYLAEGKKFIFASPEDFPPKSFYDDMIHTLSGKSTDIGRMGAITELEYEACMERLQDGFYFLHIKPPDNTIPNVLEACKPLIAQGDIAGIVIDPILKFNRPLDAPDRDDLYAGYLTSLLTEFARDTDTAVFLVMHQKTPVKEANGLYAKPSGYNVKGGGSFFDGVDNVLIVWRPNYAKDRLDPSVTVGSIKVKKQKLTGIPQDFDISFDRKSNRYISTSTGKSVFEFDKYKLK